MTATLIALLERNRRKPQSLAQSALGRHGTKGSIAFERRGQMSSPADMLRMLRATVVNGAALYNADDPDGCYKLFQQTAESVLAAYRHPGVAEALEEVNSVYAPAEMAQKLWVLRCAFDALVEELAAKEEEEADKAERAAAVPSSMPGGASRRRRSSRE